MVLKWIWNCLKCDKKKKKHLLLQLQPKAFCGVSLPPLQNCRLSYINFPHSIFCHHLFKWGCCSAIYNIFAVFLKLIITVRVFLQVCGIWYGFQPFLTCVSLWVFCLTMSTPQSKVLMRAQKWNVQ